MADRKRYRGSYGNRRRQQNRRKILIVAGLLGLVILAAVLYILQLRRDDFRTGRRAADENAEEAYDTAEDSDVVWYDGKAYRYNEHLSNYLLMGVDTKGDIHIDRQAEGGGQADTIYLLSYDRREEILRVLALPRDTMTPITITDDDGTEEGEAVMPLCLQYAYGDGRRKSCELMCGAVSHLFYGIPVNGYASVNLDSLPHLAELLGGVQVTLPDDSMADVNPSWKEGTVVTLDEENAEAFLRHRDKEAELSAWTRMNRQKVFVRAFADQLRSMQQQDAGTVTRVFQGLQPYMITNMGNDIFADLVTGKQEGGITTLPGEDVTTDNWDEFHVSEEELYALIIETFYREAG